MRINVIVTGGLAALLSTAAANAERPQGVGDPRPQWVGKERVEIRQPRLQGGGRWKAHGRKPRPRQRWSLDVDHAADGTIRGSVNVGDSMLFAAGRVEGVVKGRRVAGTIFDERGDPVARFNGNITPGGVSGSYIDRTGGTGEWAWEGPTPE